MDYQYNQGRGAHCLDRLLSWSRRLFTATPGGVLMAENVLYEEKVTSRWTQALFWGLTILFSLLFAWRRAASGPGGLAVAFLLLALLFLFYVLNYRVLVIRLSDEALALQFGLFRWTVPLADIAEVKPDEHLPAWARYGGAGIHFIFVHGRYRASFNFLEHPRVVLAFSRPRIVRDISFSTQHPEEVIRLLHAAVSARRQQ